MKHRCIYLLLLLLSFGATAQQQTKHATTQPLGSYYTQLNIYLQTLDPVKFQQLANNDKIVTTEAIVTTPPQYCPHSLNQKPELRYSVAFYTNDTILKKELEQTYNQLITKRKFPIEIATPLNYLPDILFIVAHNKSEADSITTIANTTNTHLVPLIIKDSTQPKAITRAAQKAVKHTQAQFYIGKQPQTSVIFRNGDDNYILYRIPSIVTLPNGDIVAIAEARQEGKTDCAENDMVAKISHDDGLTWGKLILIADNGKSSLNNPMVIYLEEKNRILLIMQEYPPNLYEGSTQKGIEGENIMKVYQTHSDDGGHTWTPLRNITHQTKRTDLTTFCTGPGVAIRSVVGADKGRIIVPANSNGPQGWINQFIYSDDLGETWNIGKGQSSYGTNESQIVQLSDTNYAIYARCHRYLGDEVDTPKGWRAWQFDKVTRSRAEIPLTINGNETRWGKTIVRKDLPDPLCQGSIIRYSGLKNGEKSRLLLSNCASDYTSPMQGRTYERTPPARINGTVRISYDEGKTWKYSKRIYGDRFTEFQYSVLTPMTNGRIGCIFEALPEIRFAVFDLKWLTSGTDK